MRRIIGLACVLAALTLTACSDKQPDAMNQAATQHPATTQKPTGNLCERLQAEPTGNEFKGHWTVEPSIPGLHVPPSDTCLLVDSEVLEHAIHVSVSVLPVTAADAATFRKNDEVAQRAYSAANKVIDGGVGTDSWAANPARATAWLVFQVNDRQLRLETENAGYGDLDELRSMARTITNLAGGIPTAAAVVERPECARGTRAAEDILGTKATVRRDAIVKGYLRCQWGSATRSVFARAGDGSSDAAEDFLVMQKGTGATRSHKVSVGAEGWQGADGHVTFQSKRQSFVGVFSFPVGSMRAGSILAFARAIAPAFGS
ncbi:hypothetical protein AB0L70_18675 [Kribbella sp. NPDC051952]|uniref:hypothetical protein n=1 Tax=Kribbella sp. NPDC051952 TaxID=3154851 RepID=UPI0034475DA2